VRAQRESAVVVLGSATPSLESRANVDSGRYQRLYLPERVKARPLPEVELVSLAENVPPGDGMLTDRLARALEHTLAAGEQAILYLNRRGFAPYVYCRDCGFAYRCVDCDVSLTLHRRQGALVCHYCGYREPAPDACKSCLGHRLVASGMGLEKLEAELCGLFGKLDVARLDRDSVRTRAHLVSTLARFRSGAARVLIGTQMVAKGHDFPGVTLVGVVLADASLNFPDFRAAERTFQVLTQVAGRAGRGDRKGTVIVQGYDIGHYAVEAASRHDYASFARRELATRRELGYPPYTRLALVRFEGAQEVATQAAAAAAALELKGRAGSVEGEVQVLGPAPAPLARLRGLWRMQVLLKSTMRTALRHVIGPLRAPEGVRQIVDIDPYDML
jgi:primosomal protein N' (replication factor Y)